MRAHLKFMLSSQLELSEVDDNLLLISTTPNLRTNVSLEISRADGGDDIHVSSYAARNIFMTLTPCNSPSKRLNCVRWLTTRVVCWFSCRPTAIHQFFEGLSQGIRLSFR